MLHSLAVSNYALLEQVHLELGPGMTVLTGETGSGKSILLGALGLALGDRADASVIRPGATRCTVEATFDTTGHTEWLEARGFESAGPLVLRREIAAAGRSRAFINDTPCSVTDLREIGIRCVDLHGQDETRALAERTTRLNLLDRCAGNAPEVAGYRAAFATWQESRAALDRAEQEASAPTADSDYLRYQLAELDHLRLDAVDMSALESERGRLVHAAEHRRALYHAAALLEGDDRSQGGIDLLTSAAKALQGLEGFPEAEELGARAVSLRIELQDIAHSASALAESAEEDPERLAELDQTLSEFERLKAKHRCADQTALQAFGAQLQETLDRSADRDAAVERARNTERLAREQLAAAGDALASTRHRAARELVEHTRSRLNGLKLDRAQLEFVFTPSRTPDAWGTEDVEMLFSANPGTPPLPLVQVASGGERSRLMLALKAASGAFALAPTIVLDEIDTGVSGDVAARMAALMRDMAEHRQVIAITHLPQVASRAPQHIQIYKTADIPPVTQLQALHGRERVEALAAMLSGSQITEASIANAEALLAELD